MISTLAQQLPRAPKIALLFCVCVLFFSTLTVAEAATLSVSPSTGVYTAGGTFTANVRVNTQGSAINAAEGTLSFDPNTLSVVSVSKGSIFNLWTADPSFSNSVGSISFGGGSPAGYTGSAGTVMTVTFRAKAAGDARVSFRSGSVLAADGLGTNVLTSMGSAAFTIVASEVPAEPEVIEYVAPANTPAAPSVTSTTHPDPNGWYTAKNAELAWTVPGDVTAVRTLLDGSSGSIPTKVYETPINSISIPNLDEGVSYFHIQFKNEDGWGRVRHYRLAVDTQSPTQFDISLAEDADLSNPVQTLIFDTKDESSGVSRYMVQLDGGEPFEYIDETGSSTMELPALLPGHHSVIIEAFDKAGNGRVGTFSFSILAFDKPQFTDYPSQINSEVIPVLKGITRPNAEITITVVKAGSSAEPQHYSTVSASDGVFTFIPDSAFENGVYEITAIAIDQHGAQSDPSDAIRIAVQDPGYIQIGSFIVSVLSVLVPLIALVLLLILAILYFVRKMRTVQTVVATETKEALDVLNHEFASLEHTLTSEQEALEKSRKTKKLTKAEESLLESMRDAMKKSRAKVAKEIDDVDDIVT